DRLLTVACPVVSPVWLMRLKLPVWVKSKGRPAAMAKPAVSRPSASSVLREEILRWAMRFMGCSIQQPIFHAYDQNHMTAEPHLPAELATLLPPSLHALCNTRRYDPGDRLFATGARPAHMFF